MARSTTPARCWSSSPTGASSYSWHVDFHEVFSREKPSRVTFEIEPMGTEVKLTITHDEFEPGSKVLEAVGNGWPMILASLKSLLETGRALAMTNPEAMDSAKKEAIDRATGGCPLTTEGIADMAEPTFKPKTVYVIYIAAAPEKVWTALTGPEFTKQYFFGRSDRDRARRGRRFHLAHAGWPRRREGQGRGHGIRRAACR